MTENTNTNAAPPVDNDHVAPGCEQFGATPPTLIPPTVGRIVWYWPKGKPATPSEQPQAGLVTFVHDDHTVNLVTFGHDGFPLPRHSAHLVQTGEPLPSTPYASWMPYQVGQARAQTPSSAASAKP